MPLPPVEVSTVVRAVMMAAVERTDTIDETLAAIREAARRLNDAADLLEAVSRDLGGL